MTTTRFDRLRARHPWLLTFLLTTLLFGSGVLVGCVFTSQMLWKQAMAGFREPGFAVERMMHEINREFILTDKQQDELKKVFEQHKENMLAIHNDVQPKVEEELESLRSAVENVLTPDQADLWNTRYNMVKDRWGPPPPHRRPGGPGGEGPPGADGPPERYYGGREFGGPDGGPPMPFEELDADGDGVLSLEEAGKLPRMDKAQFKRFDTNSDGSLDQNELPPPPPEGGDQQRPPRQSFMDGQEGQNGFRPPPPGMMNGPQGQNGFRPPPGQNGTGFPPPQQRLNWGNRPQGSQPGMPPGGEDNPPPPPQQQQQ